MPSLQMLGTFITEFGQGKLRSQELFASRESAEVVADQLVALALHYGFEGWLVNIENSLTAQQASQPLAVQPLLVQELFL
jgi:mannosyl-glycoprotein endo-beta-N-acetylglucosaminidase